MNACMTSYPSQKCQMAEVVYIFNSLKYIKGMESLVMAEAKSSFAGVEGKSPFRLDLLSHIFLMKANQKFMMPFIKIYCFNCKCNMYLIS